MLNFSKKKKKNGQRYTSMEWREYSTNNYFPVKETTSRVDSNSVKFTPHPSEGM